MIASQANQLRPIASTRNALWNAWASPFVNSAGALVIPGGLISLVTEIFGLYNNYNLMSWEYFSKPKAEIGLSSADSGEGRRVCRRP